METKPSGVQTLLPDGTVLWRNYDEQERYEVKPSDLYEYWKKPSIHNKETDYFTCTERSIKLVELFNKYVSHSDNVLELGCNVGRNLHFLYEAGYHRLTGIDINKTALQLGAEHYPEFKNITLINAEICDEIKNYGSSSYDVIFTMATLEHIHPREISVFQNMVHIANKYIIVAEDEQAIFWRAFMRNYKAVFEMLGCKELESFQLLCKNDMDNSGDCTLTYRVFKNETKVIPSGL